MHTLLVHLGLILVVAHQGSSQAIHDTTPASQPVSNRFDSKSSVVDVSHAVNRIIESYLIVDAKAIELLQQRGVSAAQLASTLDDMVTLINALLIDVKLWLVVYGVEFWESNSTWPINYTFTTVSGNVALDGHAVIKTLGDYRVDLLIKQRNLSVDHVNLLTGYSISVNNRYLVGLSVYNSVCARQSSTIVSVPKFFGNVYDGRYFAESLAIATAHEIGHTLNLYHDILANTSSTNYSNSGNSTDKASCECYDVEPGQCIMRPRVRHRDFPTVSWTPCTKAELLKPIPNYPRDVCFTNKPTFASFASPKCGDFVVDKGEQCDCGPAYVCKGRTASRCCNVSTCQLLNTAHCASGACCNLTDCTFSFSAASVCRIAAAECDLPEYCDGSGAACPGDTWKADGTPCDHDTGFCFMGKCRTLERQCKELSLPGTGQVSGAPSSTCMQLAHCKHRKETAIALSNFESNCSAESIPVEDESFGCTRLACQSERLWNTSRCAVTNSSAYEFLNFAVLDAVSGDALQENANYCCHSVDQGKQFELGTFAAKRDMRLVEDGTKCGQSRMCLNQLCRSIESLVQANVIKRCSAQCPINHVCNNLGNCQTITLGQRQVARTTPNNVMAFERGFDYRQNIMIVSICIPVFAVGAFLIVLSIYWRKHPLQKCHPQATSERVKIATQTTNPSTNVQVGFGSEMCGLKPEPNSSAENSQEPTKAL